MSATLPDSVPHWTHPHEPTQLTDNDLEIAELLAVQRAESYLDGDTADIIYDDEHADATDTFQPGCAGEVATAATLGYNPLEALDLDVSATGDDGSDVQLLNGRGHRLDVKTHESPPVGDPPHLLVELQKYWGQEGEVDAYVLAQTWGDGNVVLHGWVTWRDVQRRGWIERPPKWQDTNWVLSVDELRPIEELMEWADSSAF